MNRIIIPSYIHGTVDAIGSKSHCHRLLICAALADCPTVIRRAYISEDIEATIRCIEAMGARVDRDKEYDNTIIVHPIVSYGIPSATKHEEDMDTDSIAGVAAEPVVVPTLDCGESGTTLRLILPCAVALFDESYILGSGRLPERPIAELLEALRIGGVIFKGDKLPLIAHGRLKSCNIDIVGNISSQYISGLLIALSVCIGDSQVNITTQLESIGYVDMTMETLRLFGADITKLGNTYIIHGVDRLRAIEEVYVEGDWSNAAFHLVAGVIGDNSGITVRGLNLNSLQLDKYILDIICAYGHEVDIVGEDITVYNKGNAVNTLSIDNSLKLSDTAVLQPYHEEDGHNIIESGEEAGIRSISIDMSQIPDLLPIVSIIASNHNTITYLHNAARLRIKESDRLDAVANMLRVMNVDITEQEDGMIIRGNGTISGGVIDGCNDHRIVMAATVAGSISKSNIIIQGVEAVNKSYQTYYLDYAKLGGMSDVINVWE